MATVTKATKEAIINKILANQFNKRFEKSVKEIEEYANKIATAHLGENSNKVRQSSTFAQLKDFYSTCNKVEIPTIGGDRFRYHSIANKETCQLSSDTLWSFITSASYVVMPGQKCYNGKVGIKISKAEEKKLTTLIHKNDDLCDERSKASGELWSILKQIRSGKKLVEILPAAKDYLNEPTAARLPVPVENLAKYNKALEVEA